MHKEGSETMQCEFKMRVRAEELFTMFCENLKHDVLYYTKKAPKDEDIQTGFSYTKDISVNERHPNIAKIELVNYCKNKAYDLQYTSQTMNLCVSYEILNEDKDGILLRYKENKNKIEYNKQKEPIYIACEENKYKKLPFRKRLEFRQLEKAILAKRSNDSCHTYGNV